MRRIAIALGVVLVLLGTVVAAGIALRFRITTAAVRYALAQAGFADARFEVERVDRDAVVVARVESGTALRVERCEITLDWRRLPQLPVEKVRIVGAHVDVAGRAAATSTTPPAEPASTANLPLGLVPPLELVGTVATVPSPLGNFTIRLDSEVTRENGALRMHLQGSAEGEAGGATFGGEARLAEGGAVSITVNVSALEVRHRQARVAGGVLGGVIDGESSGLALRNATATLDVSACDVSLGETRIGAVVAKILAKLSRKDGAWLAEISGADLRLPGKQIHASGISGEASAKSAKILLARLEDTAAARRFEPFTVELAVPETKPELKFTADLRAAAGKAMLRADGTYDSARGVALVDLKVPRLALGAKKVRLTDVSSLLAAAGETSGAVEASAQLRWSSAKGSSGDAWLRFDDVSVNSPRIRVDGLDGEVKLRDLLPPATAGIATLHARELHPGVPFTDATLRWGLEPAKGGRGSRLRIESFETTFADGKVAVRDAVLDPLAETNTIVFQLEGLDVAKVFTIVNLQGVSGAGRLSGSIPVAVRQRAVAIPKGELVAKGGVLQVRSEQVAHLLSGGGQSVELLLDALRDFHYDELTVTVEKAFEGEASARLHLAGQNPAVMNGQPFRINMNLTGNLDRLVASLLEVARLSDQAVRATANAVTPGAHR